MGHLALGGAGNAGNSSTVLLSDNFNIADGTANPALWADGCSIFHDRMLLNYTIEGGRTAINIPQNVTITTDIGSVLVPDGTYNQPDVLNLRADNINNVLIGLLYTVSGGVVTAASLEGQFQDGTSLFSVNILPYSTELAAATEFWFRSVVVKISGSTLTVSVNGTPIVNLTSALLSGTVSPMFLYMCETFTMHWHMCYDNFLITTP